MEKYLFLVKKFLLLVVCFLVLSFSCKKKGAPPDSNAKEFPGDTSGNISTEQPIE